MSESNKGNITFSVIGTVKDGHLNHKGETHKTLNSKDCEPIKGTKVSFSYQVPKQLTKEGFEELKYIEIREVDSNFWSIHQYQLNTWENTYNTHISGWFPNKEIIEQNFIYWQWSVGEELSRIRSLQYLESIVGKESISRYL